LLLTLSKKVNEAYDRWTKDVGDRSKCIPNTFVDELLLAFMFSEYLGSSVDLSHPNQAILVPRERIPLFWKEYTEAGVVRIQEKSDMEYRLWRPYNFLMKWMRGKSTVFEFEDVEGLSAEITSFSSAPDKRKGYCFQRARMFISIIVLISSRFGTGEPSNLQILGIDYQRIKGTWISCCSDASEKVF
jgi:hypothetical protein